MVSCVLNPAKSFDNKKQFGDRVPGHTTRLDKGITVQMGYCYIGSQLPALPFVHYTKQPKDKDLSKLIHN